MADRLLQWYATHYRSLPWRAPLHTLGDPYRVWLSEVMLQQTTVTAVIPYYTRFLSHFPTINHIASASLNDVMVLWSGLGYYSRARNLYACAKEISDVGQFPKTVKELQLLPGIGVYTASAIAAMAFGVPVVPVDGNVERIVSRLFAVKTPLPQARRELFEKASLLNTSTEAQCYPGDFAQALFDLGSGVCTSRSPSCLLCPYREDCIANRNAEVMLYPQRGVKAKKPKRYGSVFILQDAKNVIVYERPAKGLLGGTVFFPTSEWKDDATMQKAEQSPFQDYFEWQEAGRVEHVFTHFSLTLTIWKYTVSDLSEYRGAEGYYRMEKHLLRSSAHSSVMRKCIDLL